MTYKVVTIANHFPIQNYYCWESYFKSLGEVKPLVLGQKEGEYTGLSDKPRILYKAIKDETITEDIIVFTDCYDVIFVDSIETIIEKFKSFDCDMLVGSERNCFPENFRKEYDRLPHTSSFKYLNSGVIIGYRTAFVEVLEAMDAENLPVDYHDSRTGRNFHFNDQAYFLDIFLRQPVKIKLDYNCFIAQNMQDVKESDLIMCETAIGRFPRIYNVETEMEPSIIHWNGGSKSGWSMQPILKHLNLL